MKKIFTLAISGILTIGSMMAQQGYRYSIVPGSDNTYTVPHKEIVAKSYAATIGLAPTMEETTVNIAQLTGALTLTVNITPCYTADKMTILFNADGTDRVVTFSTGFTSAGTFTIPASTYSAASFVFNGAAWFEISRQNNVSGSVTTLLAGNGSVGSPSISFTNDADCGEYRIGANNTGFSENGAKVLDISTTGLGVVGVVRNGAGTVSAPAYSYTAQTDLGQYKVSSSQVGFASGGTLVGGYNSTGLFTNALSIQTAGTAFATNAPFVQGGTITTYTTTANVTAAAVAGGIVAYTGSAHTLTLPSVASIISALGSGSQGKYFDFIVDNSGGSGTVTIALDASETAVSASTGGTTLTLAQSATAGEACFRLTFISGTVGTISRIF